MKIVLAAAGVEDARNPIWGHVFGSLAERVDDVFAFDHVKAAASGSRVSYQRAWLLDRLEPDLLITLGTDTEADAAMTELASARGIQAMSVDLVAAGYPARFEGADAVPVCDAVLLGPASEQRADFVRALLAGGLSVEVWGDGWDAFVDLWRISKGAPPYSIAGDVLRRGAVVLALPLELSADSMHSPQLAAIEGALAGRPVAEAKDDGFLDEVRKALANSMPTVVGADEGWNSVWERLGVGVARKSSVVVTKEGPAVTWYTGVYNIEEFIGGAIESMLNQTFGDFEILVCNDGTPDNGRAIVERYLGDPRVKLIDQQNIGQTGRFDLIWRTLLRHGKGQYLVGLGGDDLAQPNRLERLIEVFEEDPTLDIIHTGAIRMDDSNQQIGPMFGLSTSYDSTSLLRGLIDSNFIAHPTVAHRRETFEKIGELEEGYAADYHFWMKAARRCRFRYLPEALVSYRVHEKSASTGSAGVQTSIREAQRLRLEAVRRHSITDLYPFIDSDRAAAAAYVDLGNRFLGYAPEPLLALEQYERALSVDPTVAPELSESLASLDAMSRLDLPAHQYVELLHNPSSISTVPFVVPTIQAENVVRWDGTTAALQRIICVVDWNNPQSAVPYVSAFLESFTNDDAVELMFPTFGISVQDALGVLVAILPPGLDLDAAARMTIETVDYFAFLPFERYAMVLNLAGVSTHHENDCTQAMRTLRDHLRASSVGG